MINRLQLIRNIGPFDSVNGGANIPLARLTLIYAENGRGKTMLSSIFRSLATGESLLISERRRLGSQYQPHIVIKCDGGSQIAMFQNGAWNHTVSDIVVFDDSFIDQNVFSGLSVESGHRQNLHELILGSRGVTLNNRLKELVEKIENHNQALRTKGNAIPITERGIMSIDDFCALESIPDIDEEILSAERTLLAAKEQNKIRNTPDFDMFTLPDYDVHEIESVLLQDLPSIDSVAIDRVQKHLARLGPGGEIWIAEGMNRVSPTETCPFCAQNLATSQVYTHYRAYFKEEYTALKRTLTDIKSRISRTHSGDNAANFERAIRIVSERLQFWARFCDVPEMTLDTEVITSDWRTAREFVEAALNTKQATPLDRSKLSQEARDSIARFKHHVRKVRAFNRVLQKTNEVIGGLKERQAGGELRTLEEILNRLKAIKYRHSPKGSALCNEYLKEKNEKSKTERLRNNTRSELNNYRNEVFPNYNDALNNYLRAFNVGFQLEVESIPIGSGSGSTCKYNIIINNNNVEIIGKPIKGNPSFSNTLSAGDRNALALAFFFSLLDQDSQLANKIVVIDDPVSSLDEHRSLTTVQEIRLLVNRTAQVIVLSHNKNLLCNIWENADKNNRVALEVRRADSSVTLASWDVHRDCITEHDKRHDLLKQYCISQDPVKQRQVVQLIRPHIEKFLRTAYPEYFPAGTLIGPFLQRCKNNLNSSLEILNADDTNELGNIVEYTNKFHHDTNTAWETEIINDTQLVSYIRRTLNFVKR